MITVGFRFDDPSPTSDPGLERRIIEVFQRRGIPLCVAVIPFRESSAKGLKRLTSEAAAHLLEARSGGGIEIALHGYSHRNISTTIHGGASEFCGVERTTQMSRLRAGHDHLSQLIGERITGFVPPFNTYDRVTLEVAKELGFGYVSAGTVNLTRVAGIPLAPATSNLSRGRLPLEESLRFQNFSPTVILNFHPDNFFEYPERDDDLAHISIPELEGLLDWMLSLDAFRAASINDIARACTTSRLVHSSEWIHVRHLPWRIRRHVPRYTLFRSGWTTIAAAVAACTRRSPRPGNSN